MESLEYFLMMHFVNPDSGILNHKFDNTTTLINFISEQYKSVFRVFHGICHKIYQYLPQFDIISNNFSAKWIDGLSDLEIDCLFLRNRNLYRLIQLIDNSIDIDGGIIRSDLIRIDFRHLDKVVYNGNEIASA